MLSPFEVLGVSEDATDADVKARWRDLCRRYHPDHGGDEALFRTLKAAHERIDTPEKRTKERGASAAASSSSSSDASDPFEAARAARDVLTGKLEQAARATEAVGSALEELSRLFKF